MNKSAVNAVGLRPLYSFDQLVIGTNNQVAVAACQEVVKNPGEAYNPLFIYGPSGVGKTHLMQATAHEIIKADPNCKARYISAERFISEMLTAISEDKILEMRKSYSHLNLLIIDDVQYLTESKMSQEELFHIFNNMHQDNHQVILAADRPPNQLTALNKNIRSRLEWGLSTDVKVPDEMTRIQILKKKQELQGLQLTEQVLRYVARILQSNVRELEGFLKRIHAYVTLTHQEITPELVKAVLKEILPEGIDFDAVEEETATVIPPPKKAPPEIPKPVEKITPKIEKRIEPDLNEEEVRKEKDKEKKEKIIAKNSEKPAKEIIPPLPLSPGRVEPPDIPLEIEPTSLVAHSSPSSDSFDVILDSMNVSSPETSKAEKVESVGQNGNSTNGSHGEGHKKPSVDKSLEAPPALPPQSISSNNVSFDLLLESININPPEQQNQKSGTPPAPPPPVSPPAMAPPAPSKTNGSPQTSSTTKKLDPIPVPVPEIAEVAAGGEENLDASGQKEVCVVFFYPEGCKEALETVHRKFQDVIRKHKLKFHMKRVHNEPYSFKGKINYSSFVDVCKYNKVPVAIVIGPPPDTFVPEQDFYDLLTVTLDVQGVSLQLVNWGEINKDYRYLNLALDIALVRAR